MQIVDTRSSLRTSPSERSEGTGANSGTRQVYELPTPAELKNWPRQEYLKLHRAFCDLFSIPVPKSWN